MIGNKHKLKVDRDDIENKWNCFNFSPSANIENIKWALYKFDAPDFYVANEQGNTDIFLHIGKTDKGIEWQKCIFIGYAEADFTIPEKIANKFDSLIREEIRHPFECLNAKDGYCKVQLNRLIDMMMNEAWYAFLQS